MSEKTRRSMTISEQNDEWLGRTGRNASEMVDHLVTQYRKQGSAAGAILELREEQLLSEIDSLQSQLKTKEDELEHVLEQKETMQQRKEQEPDAWEKSLNNLRFETLVGETIIESPDKLIERRAGEHGLTVEEFEQEAIDRWEARSDE